LAQRRRTAVIPPNPAGDAAVLTLYSWPELFGVADNNPYGLKTYAFLKLCGVPFRHEHLLNASQAPHGQLPYAADDGQIVGDSDAIIAHLIRRDGLTIDAGLTSCQHDTAFLIRRTLDDLYWVMSYSRWQDDRFWPLFYSAFLRFHPDVTPQVIREAREYNLRRYHYHGIGRYAPAEVFARGTADLQVLSNLLPKDGFLFGPRPSSTDAGIYGFIANIHFYEIDTPLKIHLASLPKLVAHCRAVHTAIADG
jgi:glutathione S-transferase